MIPFSIFYFKSIPKNNLIKWVKYLLKFKLVKFDNPYNIIGASQIITQCFLWLIGIIINDFKILPNIFQENEYLQFLLYFLCVFHQLCLIRNFYFIISTTSEVDTIPKDKKNNKKYENYTECKKCGKLRPPRSHHCSICNLCIDKLDHHCYFLNNCIGRKNYKYFCSYVFISLLNTLIMFILSFLQIKKFIDQINNEFREKKYYPFTFQILLRAPISAFFICIISGIVSLCLIYFVCLHLYLLYYDYTSLELKYKQYHIDNPNKKNRKLSESISKIFDDSHFLNIYWPD